MKLPQSGRFGFGIDSASDNLTIKLSYEYSIIESMSATSSIYAFTILGVLAAYAIPAYQDYTIRSKAGVKLHYASGAQQLVEDYFDKNKAFPDEQYFKDNISRVDGLNYNAKTGEITLLYEDDIDGSGLQGKYVLFTPEIDLIGSLIWSCSSNFTVSQMPLACR